MNKFDFINLVNNAINALEKQGKPSKDVDGACLYLMKEEDNPNCMCIVGHMMPDDDTRIAADSIRNSGTSITGLRGCQFEWALQFTLTQIEIMQRLQYLHDGLEVDDFLGCIVIMRKHIEHYQSSLKDQ